MSDETPANTDLSTATITELVTELKKRHDALIVIGEIDRTEDDTTWCSYTKGHLSRIIGMLSRARRRVCEYAWEEERKSKEESE